MLRSLLLTTVATCAATASAAELDFYRDVYPFLKANCISCHNKTTTKADLNMETPEDMKKGGESGPALVPGKGAESLVVLASLHKEDMEMPPTNNKSGAVKLTAAEVETLKLWIDQGAKSSVREERQVAWQPLAAGVHPIYTVAMTQDGRYAACGRSNKIYIYDLACRSLLAELTDPAEATGGAHKALVQSLAFSPDGARLASGSYREVKVWKLSAAKAPSAPVSPPAALDAAAMKSFIDSARVTLAAHAISADGKLIAGGCTDGSIRVWEISGAKQLLDLRGGASVGLAQKMAELEWTIARQNLEQSFQQVEVARIDAQNKALDELLKKANEAIVAMKKALPEKQKAVEPATAAKAAAQKVVDEVAAKIAAAPGAKADAALDKELKDAQDKLITAAMGETSALAAVAAVQGNIKDAEEDVKRITASKDANAKAQAAATAALEAAKKTHAQATTDLAAAKTGLTKSTAKATAVAFSADAQRVAALLDDGTLRVWAVATGTPLEETTAAAASSTTLTATNNGAFTVIKTVSLTTGAQAVWALERTLEAAHFTDRVNAVRFSPDGKLLATGGGELSRAGDIHLFDAATGKLVAAWKEKHEDAVLSLDFSPDSKLLASGASDKIARVTEVASGKSVNLFEGHTHHVMGVAFRADGRVLATAGADGTVISWNMILGERKKKIEGWRKEVTSLQYIGATNHIVTSAGDNLIRIVNDEGTEVRAIAKLPDFMQAAASTPNGATIIGGGEDSHLRVWDGTNGREVAVFGMK
jgi:WD40 repeat protein